MRTGTHTYTYTPITIRWALPVVTRDETRVWRFKFINEKKEKRKKKEKKHHRTVSCGSQRAQEQCEPDDTQLWRFSTGDRVVPYEWCCRRVPAGCARGAKTTARSYWTFRSRGSWTRSSRKRNGRSDIAPSARSTRRNVRHGSATARGAATAAGSPAGSSRVTREEGARTDPLRTAGIIVHVRFAPPLCLGRVRGFATRPSATIRASVRPSRTWDTARRSAPK